MQSLSTLQHSFGFDLRINLGFCFNVSRQKHRSWNVLRFVPSHAQIWPSRYSQVSNFFVFVVSDFSIAEQFLSGALGILIAKSPYVQTHDP